MVLERARRCQPWRASPRSNASSEPGGSGAVLLSPGTLKVRVSQFNFLGRRHSSKKEQNAATEGEDPGHNAVVLLTPFFPGLETAFSDQGGNCKSLTPKCKFAPKPVTVS